jgi:small subunit ribosomal protein S8e
MSKKTAAQRGRDFLPTGIGEPKRKIIRTRGGNQKVIALNESFANVAVQGKVQKVKILSVIKNPADGTFVRRNIITKGAVIQTELGPARVTSRPGQTGVVNAVLIEK